MAGKRRVLIVINLRWTLKHHHELFAGTQKYAQEHDWECVAFPHPPDGLTAGRGRGGYDGIIARATPELARLAGRAGIPLVNVWLSSPVRDVPTVSSDAAAGGRMAAEHLLTRGFSSFDFVGFERVRASQLQEKGFRDTVLAAGGTYTRRMVPLSFTSRAPVFMRLERELAKWIASWRRPLGIAVVGDVLARTVAGSILAAGRRVPDDAAIVGTGNEPVVCASAQPTLSSIDFGHGRVGYRAGQLLEALMDGEPPPTEPILLPPAELVARGSTDVFAVSDPVVAKALRFIADQNHRPIRVSDVVAQVPVSWRSLQRRFQQTRRCTIEKEIARLRLARAKRLLIETKMLVKQVATACGFADATRLCESFRAAEGLSPGQYRRRHTHMGSLD